MLINLVNLLFVITLAQDAQPQLHFLKNTTVTQGIYNDRIVVEWEKAGSVSYTVLRSQYKTGEFIQVAQTSETRYVDTAVEKGIKYWYKIVPSAEFKAEDDLFITDEEYSLFPEAVYIESPVKKTDVKKGESDQTTAEKSVGETSAPTPLSYSGFTSIENAAGVKLDALMKSKKGKLKIPLDPEEKKKQKEYIDYIKPYYMNPVKLSLFMTMSRPYLDRGELKILTDCVDFEMNKDLHQVIFYDRNYNCMIIFESKKFVKILSEKDQPELADLLLKNSQLFCLYSGKVFIVDKTGLTRLVNTFDAIGLATGYLKNDIEWRSNTIMVATSRSDLKKKLQSVNQKDE